MILTNNNDTIAAIATSYGIGSISIIRISGKLSLDIAKKISKKQNFTKRVATLSKIYADTSQIDEAIIIYFKAPQSYTGEDIVEIQSHGGIVLADLILQEVIRLGARLATPGEFSKRAFLNNKMDLTKATAISALINTKSKESIKILNKILDGDLKKYIQNIRTTLIEIIAHLEVSIDYSEEDLPEDIYQNILKKLEQIILKLEKTLNLSKTKSTILNGFNLSIVGKPNVGKSSLLNSMLSFQRAIVSEIAGTTRDTIEEAINIGTHYVKLIDTAGIRESSEQIEQIGIDRSKKAIQTSDIVLFVVDGSMELSKEDMQIYKLLEDKQRVIIINKIDLTQKIDKKYFKDDTLIELSTKQDITILFDKLKSILDKNSSLDDLILISKAQIDATSHTLRYLKNAKDILIKTSEFELVSFELNSAIKTISSISKPYDYDEMLDVMFKDFCLGK